MIENDPLGLAGSPIDEFQSRVNCSERRAKSLKLLYSKEPLNRRWPKGEKTGQDQTISDNFKGHRQMGELHGIEALRTDSDCGVRLS